MKLQFGIREKFALISILLVVACAFILHRTLFERTTNIVVEHELVDLQDEGDLRCWENVNAVSRLRNETAISAGDPEHLALLVKTLAAYPRGVYRPPVRGTTGWWDDILAVHEVNLEDGSETKLFTTEGIPLPPIPELLIGAARSSGDQTRPRPLVSTILPLDIPVGFLSTGDVPPVGSEHALERVPVMWGFCRKSANPNQALAILLPLSGGSSSRHLTFIFDEDGNFLQHPIPPSEPGGNFAKIYEDLDLFAAAQELDENDLFSGATLSRQVQRGDLFDEEKLSPETPFYYLEGTASDDLREAINLSGKDRSEESKMDAAERGLAISRKLAKLNVRFGGAGGKSSAFRFLGHSEEAVEKASKFIADEYRERFGKLGEEIRWRHAVKHTLGDVYLSRFYLRLTPEERPNGEDSTDPPYYFCSAVFREELAFNVNTEFEKLRHEAAILALVSGIAAFLVAVFFVRPLRKIAKAAEQVTVKDDDSSQLQHRIEQVRRSLPIHKRDEVGNIARSLESLLRQVLNGHERLRQLNADLDGTVREQTAELREANEELRGLAAAKDEFLASVSHELRQPLNSIFGYLQFLEMSDLDEEQRGDVEKTHLAANYLHRLINDILDYQKIIMGGMELEPAEFDAPEFLQHVKDSMKPQAAERENDLVFEGIDSLGIIRNDRSRLQQILINLISNSCKFTEKGTVTVSAKRTEEKGGDRISISVSDTGRGMKPEEMEQLFVKFKKLAAREGNKTGTGLGLVICKGLCELMGGTIHCVSEFGKGTTFTVDIPASVDGRTTTIPDESPPVLADDTDDDMPGAPVSSDESVVLVIDDDTTVCSLMKRFLEGHGYSVLSANDGATGLALAKEKHPAVITLDVVLPDKDGWEILSELKSDPETADIPVVMVTFMEEKKRGYTLGADDYLVKPVDWEDFSKRIRRVLVKGNEAIPVLVVDDDPDTRALFRRTLELDKLLVIEAENGKVALQKVAETRPSVIILDLMMPVMDGFEFIDELRKDPKNRDIPVLVVTAKSTGNEDRERLEGGVRAILNKGGSEQGTLLENVLSLVHRHAPKKASPSKGSPNP